MDPANNATAWEAVQKALALAPQGHAAEQAFIRALSARYAENPPEDRKPLDAAYVDGHAQARRGSSRTTSTPPRSTPSR